MIKISKTPLRIGLFGGGTDYPDYFQRYPGAVLGTTINKYIYISSIPMTTIGEYKYVLTYSQIERVLDVEDIKHSVFREVIKDRNLEGRWHFSVMSDCPAGTGLGSSSAFTVGFIQLMDAIQERDATRYDLALDSIRIERDVLKENVGIQDQLHASFGGLNRYDFHNADFSISPVRISADCRDALNDSMLLIFTNSTRSASKTLEDQLKRTKENKVDKELSHLLALVEQATGIFNQPSTDTMLKELGKMLDEAWQTKRAISKSISNPMIDELYEYVMSKGAYGGKLCGAGGGGFLMFLAPQDVKQRLNEEFSKKSSFLDIKIDPRGSRLL